MDLATQSWPVAPQADAAEEHGTCSSSGGCKNSFCTPPHGKESDTAAAQRRRQAKAARSNAATAAASLARQLMNKLDGEALRLQDEEAARDAEHREQQQEGEEDRKRKSRLLTLVEAHSSSSSSLAVESATVCRYLCRDALHGESLAGAPSSSLWTLPADEERGGGEGAELLLACKGHIHSAACYMTGKNFFIDAHTVEVALSICTCAVLGRRREKTWWFVDEGSKLMFSAACFTIACKFCQSVEGRQMHLLRDWMLDRRHALQTAASQWEAAAAYGPISMAGLFNMEVPALHGRVTYLLLKNDMDAAATAGEHPRGHGLAAQLYGAAHNVGAALPDRAHASDAGQWPRGCMWHKEALSSSDELKEIAGGEPLRAAPPHCGLVRRRGGKKKDPLPPAEEASSCSGAGVPGNDPDHGQECKAEHAAGGQGAAAQGRGCCSGDGRAPRG